LRHPFSLALAALSLSTGPALPRAEEAATDRSQVADRYKWKLDDLYPSDEAWTRAREAFPARIEAFARRRGHLADGTKAVVEALTQYAAVRQESDRLQVYAMSRNDEDTRVARYRAMRAEAESLGVKLDAASSWMRPELLALPAARLKALAAEPRLKDWRFFLQDLLRWKPHTLSADQERLVSMAGELERAPATTFEVLTDADLPFPTVKLSTGESIRLDGSGYYRARAAADPADRRKVFQAFFGAYKGYERTIGTTFYAQLRAYAFEMEVHHFGSTLEAALFGDNIPVAVYQQLVKDANASLPTLHRYLALRKRMLGLDKLGYEDLYAPLVKDSERSYAVDEAKALVLAAVAPLGQDYQAKLRHGLESGWTDFLPSTGKRSGAYSNAVYGVHPFQLLNYNGQYDDVSTLAHESGHSMHYLLSNENQPYPTAQYATFVAEVASTLNENLLFHRSLDEAKTDVDRLSLLGERLESLRTTLFRQTMFAEFELAAHQRAEKGEALTGEALTALYLDVVRKYYGHAQGVCDVDALYGVEWAYIPHFYRDFYVFQYATSLVASTALAQGIRDDEAKGGTAARDRYLKLLSSGGSDFPVELLKKAGVDMTTSAPFQAAMADMNATMDRIEEILARTPAGQRN
jgi:oligoendopeptidase F